jgi:hypothetical protein
MKSGISIQKLAAELNRQNLAKEDYISPSSDLVMFESRDGNTSTPQLAINGHGHYGINNNAHGQLSQRLGITKPYYDRMLKEAPNLLVQNVNHWFQSVKQDHLIRTLDGSARAVMSNRYRIIDNYDVFNSIVPILMELGPSLKFESLQVTENKLYIKAVFPWIEREVQKGDAVQAGLMISNSEIGGGALSIYPLIFRLVCLNGMVRPIDGMRKNHIGRELGDHTTQVFYKDDTLAADDKALMLKVRDTVQASLSEAVFQQGVLEMQKALEVKVVDPIPTVEKLSKRMGYTNEVGMSIMEHLLAGRELTQYGLANAITRTSQDVDNYDMATQLELDGHKVLTMEPDRHGVFQVAA